MIEHRNISRKKELENKKKSKILNIKGRHEKTLYLQVWANLIENRNISRKIELQSK